MSSEKGIRTPQQARSIEKRTRLVDAAMALFSEKGFQGTNAKEIAKVASVSVGTFYAYFTDKKALLMEIIGQHIDEVDMSIFSQLQAMIWDGATGRDIMRRIIQLGHESHHHSPELLRIMLAMRYTDKDITRMVIAENKDMIVKITRLLTALGDNLRVTDLEAAARVISNAFEETMHSVAVFGTDIEQERLYEALADMTAVYLFKTPDLPLK